MDEYNKNVQPQEIQAYNEFDTVNENAVIAENAAVDEYKTENEFNEAAEEEKKQAHAQRRETALSALTGSVVAAIGAVVVGITGMLNVNMQATFNDVSYEDSTISCEVSVTDMTEKEALTIYLYENETLIDQHSLVDEDADGVIPDSFTLDGEHIAELLAEGDNVAVKYRVTLKGNVGLDVEREFDSYVVQIDKATSAFENVEGECHCGVDGYYYFKMNFTDTLGIFSDFKAYIEDEYGNRAECQFSEDLHDWQKIFVNSLKGSAGTLVITYAQDGEEKPLEIKQPIIM